MNYYEHLKKISVAGRLYKKICAYLIFFISRRYGVHILEVGCGIGSGVIGILPDFVKGIDINKSAVDYCLNLGLDCSLPNDDGSYSYGDQSFDCCVLDNVLEHLLNPRDILDEIWRVTKNSGGLIVVVPGYKGFDFDPDHKIFYDEDNLSTIHPTKWMYQSSFSIPFFFKSKWLSQHIKQYVILAHYKKIVNA